MSCPIPGPDRRQVSLKATQELHRRADEAQQRAITVGALHGFRSRIGDEDGIGQLLAYTADPVRRCVPARSASWSAALRLDLRLVVQRSYLITDMWKALATSVEGQFYSHADWERARWELWYANQLMTGALKLTARMVDCAARLERTVGVPGR